MNLASLTVVLGAGASAAILSAHLMSENLGHMARGALYRIPFCIGRA